MSNLRSFDEGEIIVSKTDTSGNISYANDVFQSVSMYTESDLLGQNHNIVRHPDMPRAIFKLVWEHIRSGKEVFAYLKNQAKNGDAYWVFAHLTPSFGPGREIRGYHSAQRAPRQSQVETVSVLYDQILAAERAESDPDAAIAAGEACLRNYFSHRAMDYDEFVHQF